MMTMMDDYACMCACVCVCVCRPLWHGILVFFPDVMLIELTRHDVLQAELRLELCVKNSAHAEHYVALRFQCRAAALLCRHVLCTIPLISPPPPRPSPLLPHPPTPYPMSNPHLFSPHFNDVCRYSPFPHLIKVTNLCHGLITCCYQCCDCAI